MATSAAIGRYLRKRPDGGRDPNASLFVSRGGLPLTADGIAGAVRRRSAEAGLTGVHAHLLRHRWAHGMKKAGMTDADLMSLGGWRSREMMDRYGRAATADRALDEYKRLRS